jgi:geranylgeranyl diphosphate synthase type II
MDFSHYWASRQKKVEAALNAFLPPATTKPTTIHRAMRYSIFAGGKRLRPILCVATAEVLGAKPEPALPLACAVECIHTYSLIHDDLPALDNDDLRRGKPTCHVVYGEDIAILAGDALQTQAYEVLARMHCPADRAIAIVGEIARATGTVGGMIGGQVMDLEGENVTPTAQMVETIHRAKTGALITVAIVSGGIYAGATPEQVERLRSFGSKAGLAFQIVDDVLDMTQNSEELGKTAGKDTATQKATWPAVYGIEKSEQMAQELIHEAFSALAPFGEAAAPLKAVAHYLVARKN